MSETATYTFVPPPMGAVVPLRRLKEAFVVAAIKPKLFQPMRSFFSRLELVEGDVPTALATLEGDRRLITIGRKFWLDTVCPIAEQLKIEPAELGVDLLFHESWHHLWRHLEHIPQWLLAGYSHDVQNLATDSLINGNINRFGRARFFEHWYKDKPPMAFLRPNSRILTSASEYSFSDRYIAFIMGMPDGVPKCRSESTASARDVLDADIAAFYGRQQLDDDLRKKHKEHCQFYRKLQRGTATLKEALDFFQNADFGQPPGEQEEIIFVGSHPSGPAEGDPQQGNPQQGNARIDLVPFIQGSKPGGITPGEGKTESEPTGQIPGGKQPGKQPGEKAGEKPDEEPGGPWGGLNIPFFERDEAKRVLEALGLLNPQAKNNFERIAEEVTTYIQTPGDMRTGVEVLHRLPSRLGRNDLSTIVRGGRNFEHDEYQLKKVTVLIDLSGSMDAYVPFIIALMRKMSGAELEFEVIVWADKPMKMSFNDFIKGNLPRKEIGGGTAGEPVAAYIRKHNIVQAVIITDNHLGDRITTKVHARLHVCLTDGAKKEGGFLDKKVAPDSRPYQLLLKQLQPK